MSAVFAVAGVVVEALLLTLAVELPVAALLGLRNSRALLAVVAVNLLTNPALNLALIALALSGRGVGAAGALALCALEIAAVSAEWVLLLAVLGGSRRRTLGVAIAMNAASFAAGLLVFGKPGVG